ncbi:MAG: outer membrane beta-barrel protein [Xanthobacteraceae bacterium]|nr:outer membrane beta-barrel protein [Xanthobacteraceae bacterium]
MASAAAIALSAAQALAADLPARMPVKAPPPVVAPVFTWTGCYVGMHGGYAWGRKKDWTEAGVLEPFAAHDVDGPLFGGQVGCNLQHDRWVFGIEGQASWADVKGNTTFTSGLLTSAPITNGFFTKADILGTIAARLGIAFDRSLLFVKGGLAFAHEKHWLTAAQGAGPAVIVASTDKYLRWGWMVGGGWEYAFSGRWSGKIEYNYLHLGRDADPLCPVPGPGTCVDFELKQHIHLVKVGINYRFTGGDGPLVARY